MTAVSPLAADTSPDRPGPPGALVDVRTPAEYAAGHLEGAVNIDVTSPAFAQAALRLDPAASYELYCLSGARSAAAAGYLRENGFTRVTDLGAMTFASLTTNRKVVRA
jgi:rhodanese-related sulfurtransferase